MVDYTFNIPQPYDPSSDVANALKFRQAQQEQAVNQLKLQAWMQDRAYELKQRQAAAANAATKKAREQELLGIYGNFGVTPAVTGRPGVSYSGTGVANDPYATIQNQLIQKGFLPQATDVAEYRNKMLTGEETAAKTAKFAEETKGVISENDKKKVEARAAQIKEYGDAVLRAGSVDEVNSLIDSHADVLGELGISAPQAKQNFADLVNRVGFDAAIMQSSQGAMATQKHINDQLQTIAQTNKTTTETQLAVDKQKWEQEHPGYELKETAQGWVAINKNNPNDVTLIQINGQAAMPKPALGAASNLTRLMAERDSLPANDPRRKQYDDAIAKETGGPTPAQVEGSIAGAEDAVAQIDKLLKHPGFSEAVGAGWGTSYIPGSDAKGAIALHNQVTGTAFLDAYNALRGTGSITEIEGKKATAAKTRMDLSTSEKDYIEAAKEFQDILKRGIEREKARLKSGGAAAAPAATSSIFDAADAIIGGK
jgi:hypothetical protein